MKNKKVFISGGAGVIGRELIKLLIQEGAEIFVGDLIACPSEFKNKIIYRQGDLNYLTKQEIENFNPEIFFHLAATFERSKENYDFWEENHRNNCKLTYHLINLIKDLKSIKKIIFASSYLIYDPRLYQFKEAQNSPISLKESDHIYPRNLTGVAKLSHEIDLRFLNEFKSKQFSTISVRIFRGYGCNSRDVISRWIRDLINKKPIYLYNSEGIFDYIYSSDSAKGLLLIAKKSNLNGVINLGTGKARKVKDIIKILKLFFPESEVIYQNKDLQFEASQANIELLKNKINWSPEYDLERAIPLMIDYEKKRVSKSTKIIFEPKVLITSSGKKVTMIKSVKNALNKLNPNYEVICGDIKENCLSKYVSNGFIKIPETKKENLDLILSILRENKINVVIPSRDGELIFFAENLKRFMDNGINIIISPLSSIQICLDKLKFYKFGQKNNFNFIKTSKDLEEIKSDKYVVKEQFGSGSRTLRLNLNKDEALSYAKKLTNPIFQPYIKGKEISIDAWLDSSYKVKGIILRTRDLIEDGESIITTTFTNEIIENDALKILETLKLRGPIVLQAIIKENIVYFMECNSRFGGGSNISLAAGLDSFYWSILELQGEDLKKYKFFRSNREIRKVKVNTDLYFNL